MEKKGFSVLFFLLSLSLFAQWDQQTIALDNPVYKEIEWLFRQAGQVVPTAVYPWTIQEAKELLDSLHYMEEVEPFIQRRVKKRGIISQSTLISSAIPLAASIDIQGYHVIEQQGEELLLYPLSRTAVDRGNFLEIPFCFSMLNQHLYMELNLNFREDLNADWETPKNISNIPLGYYDVDLSFPHSAYISVGGSHWNILSGRSLQNWGKGQTGNLLLSDNPSFHELIRFKTNHRNFNYTYGLITLDPRLTDEQYQQYFDDNPSTSAEMGSFSGQKYFMLHDFEFRPIPSLRIGLTEGLLAGGSDFQLTPAFFNPMMLFHNWFTNISVEGNGIHMIEMDWAIGKQLIYGQICLDQYQSKSEKESFAYAANEPDSYGLLLGVNRLQELYDGLFSLTLEGTWTLPYLYTAQGYYTNHSINEYHTSSDSFYRNIPLGYKYGNDAMVFSLYAEYFSPKKWDLSAECTWVLKGINTISTPYPFGELADESIRDQKFPGGPVNKKLFLMMQGNYRFTETISMNTGNLLIFQENPDPLYNEHGGIRYNNSFWSVEPWISFQWTL